MSHAPVFGLTQSLITSALAGLLLMGSAAAQADSPAGRWANQRTGDTLEFRQDGAVLMSGSGSSSYRMCGESGGNICITGKGFSCHYRAVYQEDRMTLQLFTGRPTKNCPEGVFRRPSN